MVYHLVKMEDVRSRSAMDFETDLLSTGFFFIGYGKSYSILRPSQGA